MERIDGARAFAFRCPFGEGVDDDHVTGRCRGRACDDRAGAGLVLDAEDVGDDHEIEGTGRHMGLLVHVTADGVDEDNPGASKKMVSAESAGNVSAPGQAKVETKEKPEKEGKKAGAAAKRAASDHDRGHGNDADGVDEDNPGKSHGK